MTTRNVAFIVHPAKGGLDLTTPPTLLQPDQLVMADNCEYGIAGGRSKRLGTARYNPTAITTNSVGDTITGLVDFWRHGTCLEGTQRFMCHAGQTIFKSDGDGVWTSLNTQGADQFSFGSNGTPGYFTVAQGYAVISNGVNQPQKWDQTTLSALSAGAPYFTACVYHLRRLFGFGYASNPSAMWYTAAGDITDFTGSDTGTLILDEDDGDRIVGVSHPWQGRIYAFKGPNVGSVWNLAGTTVNSFTKTRMFAGSPCVSHRSVVTTPQDIFWASRYGIHSLKASEQFGDTAYTLLSRPVQSLYEGLSQNHLEQIVGFSHPARNIVGWIVPESGQNSAALVYNYALGLWAVWRFSGFAAASAMVALSPQTRLPRLYLGGYNGFVYAGDQPTKSDENADQAYTYRVRTPIHQRFSDQLTELAEKSFYSVTTFYAPVATPSTLTVQVWVDNFTDATSLSSTKTITLAQGGDRWDVSWVWDQSLWDGRGGGAFDEFNIEGRGRSVQIEWQQNTVGGDVQLLGYALRVAPAEGHAYE